MLVSLLCNRVTLALGAVAVFAVPVVGAAVETLDKIARALQSLPF